MSKTRLRKNLDTKEKLINKKTKCRLCGIRVEFKIIVIHFELGYAP